MPQIQQVAAESQFSKRGYSLRGHENGDLPVDDPPPVEHPSESYRAWRATAIYDLAPFSLPAGR
jgi:hypothetical protein